MSVRDVISPGLVAIAFTLSIFYYGGDSTPWLTWSVIVLLVASWIRIQPVFGGANFAWSPAHWWALGYAAWLGVLVWLSTLPENSLQFFWMMAAFPVVFLLASGFSRETWLRLFALFLIPGLFSAVWGIAEFVETGRRANGQVIDPNVWGALHNFFFFATLSVFLGAARRYQAPLALALLVFAVAVFCSYSRVGTALFAVALPFVLLLLVRYRELRVKLAVAAGAAILAFSLVHGYASQTEATHPEGYTFDIEKKGWSQRFSLWRGGLRLYADYPLVGSGPGTFKLHYPRYRDKGDLDNLGNYVHNDYIQYLAEGGPLLLLFLLAYAGYLTVRLVSDSIKLARGDKRYLESVVLIVAMGTSLTHGLMNFVLYQVPIIMLSALCFARLMVLHNLTRPRRIVLTRPALGRVGSTFVLVVLVAVALLDQLSNDLVYEQDGLPFTDSVREEPAAYFDVVHWLTILRSGNSTNHIALATLYRQSFDQQTDLRARRSLGIAAAIEYQRALSINPFRGKTRRYFAEFLAQNAWLQTRDEIRPDPEALLREGVRLAPVFPASYFPLVDYLEAHGRRDEAYRLLKEKALPWADIKYPGYREARLTLFSRLLKGAKARGDTELQRRLLGLLGG